MDPEDKGSVKQKLCHLFSELTLAGSVGEGSTGSPVGVDLGGRSAVAIGISPVATGISPVAIGINPVIRSLSPATDSVSSSSCPEEGTGAAMTEPAAVRTMRAFVRCMVVNEKRKKM